MYVSHNIMYVSHINGTRSRPLSEENAAAEPGGRTTQTELKTPTISWRKQGRTRKCVTLICSVLRYVNAEGTGVNNEPACYIMMPSLYVSKHATVSLSAQGCVCVTFAHIFSVLVRRKMGMSLKQCSHNMWISTLRPWSHFSWSDLLLWFTFTILYWPSSSG